MLRKFNKTLIILNTQFSALHATTTGSFPYYVSWLFILDINFKRWVRATIRVCVTFCDFFQIRHQNSTVMHKCLADCPSNCRTFFFFKILSSCHVFIHFELRYFFWIDAAHAVIRSVCMSYNVMECHLRRLSTRRSLNRYKLLESGISVYIWK